jgi:hypothetical protein
VTEARSPKLGGKVRTARFTDLAALGELSRLCQDDEAATRSLGLPVSGPPIGVFSLFRLPLGAFRPHDVMFVYEEEGRLAGLIRFERDTFRDEWTIVELDGIGSSTAGDIRFPARPAARPGVVEAWRRPPPRGLRRPGRQRRAVHAGGLHALRRGDRPVPRSGQAAARAVAGREGPRLPDPAGRPGGRGRAAPALRDGDAAAHPAARGDRLADWERQGANWRIPRSSLAPILRFADVEAFVQETPGGGKDGTQLDAFAQIGVAKEDQPHYLKVFGRPGVDVADIADYALGAIAARTGRGSGHRSDQGVIARSGRTSRRSTGDSRKRGSIRSPVSRCS